MIANANSVPLDDDDDPRDQASVGKSPAQPVENREGQNVGDEYPVLSRERGEQGLLRRAIAERWPMSRRKRRRAIKRTMEHIENEVPEVSLGGLRVLVAMEGQNQRDQMPSQTTNVTNNVVIVESDDWYGNNAHDLAAKAAAASNSPAALPGKVQDAGVWPALGQNGSGVAGDN